jgi:rubrerythrin
VGRGESGKRKGRLLLTFRRAAKAISDDQLRNLLHQALETELGGVQVYEAALKCAQRDDVRKEWEEYHEQTTHHIELITGALHAFGLDPETETLGRRVVRHIGEALVQAMETAQEGGPTTRKPLPPSV